MRPCRPRKPPSHAPCVPVLSHSSSQIPSPRNRARANIARPDRQGIPSFLIPAQRLKRDPRSHPGAFVCSFFFFFFSHIELPATPNFTSRRGNSNCRSRTPGPAAALARSPCVRASGPRVSPVHDIRYAWGNFEMKKKAPQFCITPRDRGKWDTRYIAPAPWEKLACVSIFGLRDLAHFFDFYNLLGSGAWFFGGCGAGEVGIRGRAGIVQLQAPPSGDGDAEQGQCPPARLTVSDPGHCRCAPFYSVMQGPSRPHLQGWQGDVGPGPSGSGSAEAQSTARTMC